MGGEFKTNSSTDEHTNSGIGTEEPTTFNTNTEPISSTTGSTPNTETSGLNPPKRGRGRPTGWRKGQTNTNTEKASINFQEEEQVTPSTTAFSKRRKKAFMSETEANSTTEFVLATIDMLGVALLKTEEAKLNPLEKGLLISAIPKYLQTLETDTLEKATNLMYPLMGILGVSMYALRVASIVVDKRKENKLKQEIAQAHENINSSIPDEHTNGVNPQWNKEPNLQNDLNMQTRNRGF